MRARVAVLACALVALAVLVAGVLRGDAPAPGVPVVPTPPGEQDAGEPIPDPFAYDPDDEDELVRRAASGTAHALYARSPGGATATAERVDRWRPQVEDAAAEARVDPDLFEALVFLESAGRENAMAGDTEGAVGLTQILAETGQSLLGMEVDVERSRRLTRRLGRAIENGRTGAAEALIRERRAIDERFDPGEALAGTSRYLTIALEELGGREDLAFVSYHMGIGNLQQVLADYGDDDASYARVYFDSTPARHPEVQQRLTAFGDDSSNYLWKLHAAREIMRLYREDPAELTRLQALQTAKNSAEEVLHPPGSTPVFGDPSQLRAAWDDDAIRAFPNDPALTGLARDARMGELARRLGVPAGMYRGLRPEALALALYIGAQTRELSGEAPLIVTSTVRDQTYQDLLVRRNREATQHYSLHTTGWAFDVARIYESRRQALAFQFVLDRLQALDVIAWVREPGAIHITVSRDAETLLPLLERLD